MAYRLFALLPLLLVGVSADTMESMNDVASVAEPMAPIPIPAPAAQQQQQEAPAVAAAPPVISHEQAEAVVKAAVAKALEIKMPSNIAVTDPSGHLVSFLRMDGAMLVSIEVAQKKAKTVSMFGGKYRTGDLYNVTSPGGPLYGECIQTTNSGLLFFGGGVPLKVGGNFVGSLGISGGTVDQDQTIANAAAQSLNGLAPVPASKAPVAPVAAPQAQAPNASVLTQDGDKEAKTL
ncbi:hypothetical protein EG327_004216 [Venturia inaequalis]|uniref:DUF336-domain-containing protein n=1 Tax=Venturia inaequalis TaxID=5025 RepID=A0A8H3ZAT9_VENIN|nr:hypothetical protein EG327_004216 [Venturia inaequalis]